MLARARLPPLPRRLPRRHLSIPSLANAYIDLAQAIPYPAGWPIYSLTIIGLTLATRLAVNFPIAIWVKKRVWRIEDEVNPRLLAYAKKPELVSLSPEKQKRKINQRRKELMKQFNCTFGPTVLIGTFAQLPSFIALSLVFNQACLPPTCLDMESFFFLSSLIYPDSTMALPIAVGLITFANVETSQMFNQDPLAREKMLQKAERKARDAKTGIIRINPADISKPILRVFAIARLLASIPMPGAVVVYWTCSAAIGLVQTWVLDFWASKRKKAPRAPR